MNHIIAKDSYQFKGISALGLDPSIHDLSEYKLRIERNIPTSHEWLIHQNPLLNLTCDTIRYTHRLIFHDIHPSWAGTFRGNEKGLLKVGRYVAADWQRVDAEMEGTLAQLQILLTKNLFETPNGRDLAPFAAIAFFHCRMERIHPFRDGNGRTGRVIMSAQAKSLTGKVISFNNRDAYMHGLHTADEGFLTPLINVVLEETGHPPTSMMVPCPFRVGPYAFGDSGTPTTLETFLVASREYAVKRYMH